VHLFIHLSMYAIQYLFCIYANSHSCLFLVQLAILRIFSTNHFFFCLPDLRFRASYLPIKRAKKYVGNPVGLNRRNWKSRYRGGFLFGDVGAPRNFRIGTTIGWSPVFWECKLSTF
jgi:hypothetical protein